MASALQSSTAQTNTSLSEDNTAGAGATSREVPTSRSWLQLVEEKVRPLRYGVVQITVHDGKVVQIDRTERTRLDPAGDGSRRQPYTVLR